MQKMKSKLLHIKGEGGGRMKSCPILLAAARIEDMLAQIVSGPVLPPISRIVVAKRSACKGDKCEWYVKSERYTR